MSILFPRFLADPQEYHDAERLWVDRWSALVVSLGEVTNWRSPWSQNVFADGTPIRDGNPIFSAICPSRRLGIRVIQLEAVEEESPFTFWLDTFAAGDSEEVNELVVSCILTEETLADSIALMHQWVVEGRISVARSY